MQLPYYTTSNTTHRKVYDLPTYYLSYLIRGHASVSVGMAPQSNTTGTCLPSSGTRFRAKVGILQKSGIWRIRIQGESMVGSRVKSHRVSSTMVELSNPESALVDSWRNCNA